MENPIYPLQTKHSTQPFMKTLKLITHTIYISTQKVVVMSFGRNIKLILSSTFTKVNYNSTFLIKKLKQKN